MPRLPRTLLWRLCLALIVIQVVVAIVFGTHAYRSARGFHHQQTLDTLQRLALVLADSYVAAGAEESERLDHLVKHHGHRASVRVTLIDAHDEVGRVLADSHREPAVMDNHANRPEVRAAFEEEEGTSTRFSDSVLEQMMYFAQLIGDPETSIVLRTAVPLTEVNADLRRLLWTLGTAGMGLLLITTMLVYIVSRAFSRTVSSLADQASTMASAQRFEPLGKPSVRELAPLASALNNMANRLHDRINELQQHRHEHEAILQSMHSGVIALDLDQRILRLNRAAEAILGVCQVGNVDGSKSSEQRSIGRLLQEVVRSAELNDYVMSAMREASGGTVELRLRSEPARIVEASSSPLTDTSGRRVGILLVLNDVTPLRRLESLRSDFAANVSHELRTPITNIKGYVETMLEVGVDDVEQARRFLDIIKRNSDRLAAIIEDILSLAWLEQSGTRQSLTRELTELAPVIDSVLTEFQSAAKAKGITIRSDIPPSLGAPINRQLIEQAVANYLSNAIKYSPASTTVTVTATATPDGHEISGEGRNSGGWVEIAVTDEGPGISPEHLPRIFERFYRVDKARSRKLGGTGLGLAIVKHIALVHGGRADVESHVGRGSTFRIMLPTGA